MTKHEIEEALSKAETHIDRLEQELRETRSILEGLIGILATRVSKLERKVDIL